MRENGTLLPLATGFGKLPGECPHNALESVFDCLDSRSRLFQAYPAQVSFTLQASTFLRSTSQDAPKAFTQRKADFRKSINPPNQESWSS
jgi:hypothetical protein